MQDKSLAATNKNLVKNNFPYIDTFDHQGPTMLRAMFNLTVGFLNTQRSHPLWMLIKLFITCRKSLVKQRLKSIIRYWWDAESEKGIAGYQWDLVLKNNVTMENFWTW